MHTEPTSFSYFDTVVGLHVNGQAAVGGGTAAGSNSRLAVAGAVGTDRAALVESIKW